MRALPVIERELIVAARKPWTARTRILFALAAILICLTVLAVPRMPAREQGPAMLNALSLLSFLFALLSGCFLTADCLSREKREGTLGLLFLTPLRYRDVVLGKLVSSSVVVVCGLLAVFPVFFLPLLSGGVSWGEVLRVLLTVLVSLGLSLTVGILASVLSFEAKTSVLATFTILILLALVPFGFMVLQAQRGLPLALGAAQLSPLVTLILSFDRSYPAFSPNAYWNSLALQGLLTAGGILLSVNLLSRRWATSPKPLLRHPRPGLRRTSPQRARASRRLPARSNPYAWAAARGSTEPIWFRTLRGIILLVIGSMTVVALTTERWREAYMTAFTTAYVLHLATKFMLALEATRPLQADRLSGALELLLVTPVGARYTLPGAHIAFRQASRASFRCLTAANAGLLLAAFLFQGPLHMDEDSLFIFTLFYGGGLATAFADRTALAWVGFRQSLVAPTQLKAALMTLAQVMIPGWLMFGGVVLATSVLRSAYAYMVLFAVWYAGCLAYTSVLVARNRTLLKNRFRELAAGGHR